MQGTEERAGRVVRSLARLCYRARVWCDVPHGKVEPLPALFMCLPACICRHPCCVCSIREISGTKIHCYTTTSLVVDSFTLSHWRRADF